MMLTKIFILAVLTFLFTKGKISAQDLHGNQEPEYHVKQYTDENGLPQNSVRSLARDKNGFLWIATENGLVRFDGHNFYVFNKSNTGQKNTRFHTIQPDITRPERFYGVSNDFEMLRIENSVAVSDSSYLRKIKMVPHINEGHNVSLLASGSPNYLWEEADPLYYIILSPNAEDRFFILHRNRIEFFDKWKKAGELQIKSPLFRNYFSLGGNLYKVENDNTILCIDTKGTKRFSLTGDILEDPDYQKPGKTLKVYWNNISDQVFILLNQNFYYLSQIADSTFRTQLILRGFDFETNNIITVHYDQFRSRIFLGSLTRGLFVFSEKMFRTLRFGERDMDNIFYAQTLFDHKNVLTPGGIIFGDETKQGLWRQHEAVLPAVRKNFKLDGRSILTDQNGFIWIKSGELLYRYAPKGQKLLHSWNLHDEIKTIYQGWEGRIWIGLKSKGLFYIRHGQENLHPKAFNTYTIKNIVFILQSNNSLWLATEQGLYNVSLKTGRTAVIKGTERMFVRSLYISPSSTGLFFTTYEDGILYYNRNKLVQFPPDVNGYLAAAHCITEDQKGFFWITTNKGLFQVSKKDLLNYTRLAGSGKAEIRTPFYLYYAKDHGFKTNEFDGGCQPCSVKLPDGHFSLPSLNGLVWFKPEDIESEQPDGKLLIDRLEVHGKSRFITNDTITLPVNPKNISLSIATAYFGNINNLLLSYKISGDALTGKSEWISLKAGDPVIRFSELGSGAYFLQVKKVSGFGSGNEIVKSLTIIVNRNWYEKLWFQLICVGVALLIIYLYIRFRIRHLRNRNQELEEKVMLRTQNLEQTLLALRDSEKELNRQMHIQSRLIASISHDIRTPLKYMISFTERINGFINNKEYDTVSDIGKSLTTSGKRMYQLLENMIGYIKTQVYGEHLQKENILLRPLVKTKAELFSQAIQEQSNKFIYEVPAKLSVETNVQLFGIVIHNLIDNANKYTYQGVIRVSVENRGGSLHFIVADSGPGMPDNLMDWLNQSSNDFIEKSATVSEDYHGLGLLIVKEISALLHLTILVEKENGTRVHLIFNSEK
ncbi:sensor histidine kinase [Dyadobacter psychrotolerans]|nr:ATP-binding protein [Dyadobacter psychrotolerans]